MHKIEVIGTNAVLSFPENGLEFNRDQFIAFSRLQFLYQTAKITYQEFRVRLVYDFLNMKRTANLDKPENQPVIESVNSIAKFTDVYFEDIRDDGKLTKVIKMNFFLQRLPIIKAKGIKFYGPTDALTNTVYGEYLQLLTHFDAYSKTGDAHALDLMIATIYRPKKRFYALKKRSIKFDGDIRRKFNSNLTNRYAKHTSKLPLHIKHAIYLFVASCQHFIATNDALDIGGGNTIDLSILFKKEKNSNQSTNGLGMVGTLYSLAETKVFGAVKEVANHNTYDILTYLVSQTIEYNKIKANATNT